MSQKENENENENKTIFNLKLNETLYGNMKYGLRTDITRVASGWIYQPIIRKLSGDDEYIYPCFVPYSEELT